MNRIRTALLGSLALVLASAAPAVAAEWRHGAALTGTPKYEPGFPHFDYVNPDAPKGGSMRLEAVGTFDTLNPFNVRGNPAAGLALLYDQLMETSLDEPNSEYGLLAEAMRYPEDYSSVTFRLRPEARWHDGEPITVEDVIWSLETLRENHPFYNAYYRHVERAEQTGEREVTFHFDETGNRELPQILGQLYVLPKHWWTAAGPGGEARDFGSTTLEPPLGSGPYRIADVSPGRRIAYERVEDYWGKDLPVNVGRYNFDRMAYEYFRDRDVSLEAFKADQYDFRTENSAKRWATGYDFPAVQRGEVVREEFTTKQAEPMQGFVFNLRRERFADPRVRRAFNLAFDFEWLNENIFYGQYERTDSYFQNSELAATGLPEGRELEFLEAVRDVVPPEVFTEEYRNPVGGSPREIRGNLREAARLLREAGYRLDGGTLVHGETGRPLDVEFLIASPETERVIAPYAEQLKRLGVRPAIRLVDVAQYQRRLDTFDFDVVTAVFPQSLSPGNEQRDFWGSDAADREGSRNLAGIKDPAVDALIERIIFAETREDLVAASRALDRVLLWNHYLVPQFHSPTIRTAYWNRFGHPDTMPDYGFTTMTWWYDEEKAGRIATD